MKKSIISIILVLTFVLICTLPVSADVIGDDPAMKTNSDGSIVYIFEDGSKIIVGPTIVEEIDGTRATRTAHKDVVNEDSSGNMEWKYTLSASFTYNYGVSVSCTGASYSQTIYKGNWTFSNGSATYANATATGQGNFVKKLLFIVLHDIDIDIHITCDIYGNVT